MLWKEIKTWSKQRGYSVTKTEDSYSWFKIDNPDINGTQPSVSKLAKAIFNSITDNQWLDHQAKYIEELDATQF